ncbi:MAG: ABC transporter substrate-binding protein [Acidimicrobiia bacterium]|nr:MAG: ABC transporter substrate-binding protein [Acidimicrobiia bacterium]
MRTRWRSLAASTALLALIAAACGTPGGGTTTTTAAPTQTTAAPGGETTTTQAPTTGELEPLRIGVLQPLTGAIAASGNDAKDGWELYWQNHPTEIAGRKIEWRVEDTGGDPDTALQKVDELVQNFGAEIIVGELLANVTLALADRLADNPDVLFVVPIGSADDMTQRRRDEFPNMIRAGGWTSSQTSHVLGDWAYEQGYRKVATMCTDYAFGHEMCGGFVHVFTYRGGEVDPSQQLWNPLGTQDMSTYVTQLADMDVDAVFALQVGGSVGDFLTNWHDFGLKDRIPLLGGEVLLDNSNIRNLPPEVVEGLISSGHWTEGRDEPTVTEFVELVDAATGKIPSYYVAATWTAAQYIQAALEALDGDTSDKQKMIEAMQGFELETPFGISRMDSYGNPIYDIAIRRVEVRDDGRVWNVPVEIYENVDQFWPFTPEEYLQQPVYSREFQGNLSVGEPAAGG